MVVYIATKKGNMVERVVVDEVVAAGGRRERNDHLRIVSLAGDDTVGGNEKGNIKYVKKRKKVIQR